MEMVSCQKDLSNFECPHIVKNVDTILFLFKHMVFVIGGLLYWTPFLNSLFLTKGIEFIIFVFSFIIT